MSKLLKEYKFSAEINFIIRNVKADEVMDLIDVGAVTLKCEDRVFVLDSYYTDFWDNEDEAYVEIRCKLEVDEDTFKGEYTLLAEDMMDINLESEFYCTLNLESEEMISKNIAIENLVTTISYYVNTLTIPTKLEE